MREGRRGRTSLRVLIVDDEPQIVELLTEVLRGAGHAVYAAYDGLSALAKVERTSFDVLVLDLAMPGMSGVEFFAALRRQSSPLVTRTVVCCANLTAEVKGAFSEVPAYALMEKPFDTRTIVAALERLAAEA